MKMLRTALLMACIGTYVMQLSVVSLASGPAPLMDLAEMRLQTSGVEVVDEINGSGLDWSKRITAADGETLIVVTLKGTAPRPCSIPVGTRQFSAIWEVTDVPYIQMRAARAIAQGENWTIATEGAEAFASYYQEKAGPVVFKVALSLPKTVTSFFVRYPTIARGAAKIRTPG